VLKTWRRLWAAIDKPMPLRVMVGVVVCAVKVYHTSGEPTVPQNALIPAVAVAGPETLIKELVVFTQAVPD